ncbi:MAG: efflux RND transporter permease subunit [Planctomycetes bacterium]|nr:efflux RND transporter permease subunit [Planctomycetota bacterium]
MSEPTSKPASLTHRGLIGLFVDRPVTTLMVTLAMLVIGLLAFSRLPLRFLPDGITQNQINVWIPVRQNQSPQEIHEKIIEPLAEKIRTIPGLKQLRSRAGSGSGWVSARLDENMNPGLAAAEIRDRTQRAMLQWPKGVDRYFTWKEDGSSAPLAFVQFLTPSQGPEWNHKLDQIVRTRLESVDGVGRIDIWGLLDESIRIWFDRDKIEANHLDFGSVLELIRTDNFAMPIGELHVEHDRQSYLVRVDSKFHDTKEIAQLPIRPGIVLGDIATIERRPEVRDELSRFDGKYTCTAVIRGAADANPVATSDALHLAMLELEQDPRLLGLKARWMFDQGKFIRDGLGNLVSTAIEGGLLALLVLWYFLRNWAMTLVIALAIPITLLAAGAQLYFGGKSLDICTMCGMTLAVGMVVDNAVVVLENVRRLREQGYPVHKACILGTREVSLAVTMSTLSSVVVFLPMAFLGSPSSRVLLGAVGVPLSTALIASLLVAMLLMPSALNWLGGGGTIQAAGFGQYSPLSFLLRFNERVLNFGLRHRLWITAIGILLLSTSYFATKFLEVSGDGMDPFQNGDIAVHYTMPRGTGLKEANDLFMQFESYANEHKQEWGVTSIGGRFGRKTGRVEMFLPNAPQKAEADALRLRILANWPRIPGVQLDLGEKGSRGMGGRSESAEQDDGNFVVRLYGRDSEYLMARALALQERLRTLPEVEQAEVPALEDQQEVIVQLDRDRVQDLGILPEAVLGTMASGLQGNELGKFEESDREVRLIAQYDARKKPSLLDLKDTRVMATKGGFQQLNDISQIAFKQTVKDIESQDGRINVLLTGKRKKNVTQQQMSSALAILMPTFPLLPGYSWSEERTTQKAAEDVSELLRAMSLSIVLIFLLMGVLFESVILPLSILITIPFALFGATWSMVLFFGHVDSMSIIGMLILCGIVVNNGIVLLDYIGRLRAQGFDRATAIREGVRVRMRPIFMTAATTFVGLLPMAIFGEANEGISYKGLSIAVAGGLAFSTVFTSVAVPLAYTFADDLTRWLRSICSGFLRPQA